MPKLLGRSGLGFVVGVLFCCVPAIAQQDPENEKRLGLWLDQTQSVGLSPRTSLEFALSERFDEGASNLFEYFGQAGVAFRLRPWLTLLPVYRYIRFPGSTTSYENRPLLNVTLNSARGRIRPIFRTRVEGRFPENRTASARFRFRPGIDYTLPFRMTRPPVLVVANEFFVVPSNSSFVSGGHFSQNRFQVGFACRWDGLSPFGLITCGSQ